MIKKKGLGKGLGALLSDNTIENHFDSGELESVSQDKNHSLELTNTQEIDITLIDPNPNQPRTTFDKTSLQELSDSIKTYGIVSPLIVVKKNNRFMLIAGERRFRAAKLANLTTLPCIIKKYDNSQIKEISLIDNIQREDLNAIEVALYLKQLMVEFNYTQEKLSERIGKSRSQVTNLLRLLNLSQDIQGLVINNSLSVGHARCLVVVQDHLAQIELANICIKNDLSVREFEELVKTYLEPKKNTAKALKINHLHPFAQRLQTIFDTKVSIEGNDNKGRICISYSSNDDLEKWSVMIGLLESL
jgi:ParB family chromosome partitioning protein